MRRAKNMFRRLGLTGTLSTLTLISAVLFGGDAAHSRAAQLDMSKLSMVFREDFDDRLSVSPWGPNTRWIAHTPWHGDFGDAQFADPVQGFPFTVSDGILRIEARKDSNGKWQSGLLSSADENGRGFSLQYGYFEMRAKLPPGLGCGRILAGDDSRETRRGFAGS